jgi:hypothetical protein
MDRRVETLVAFIKIIKNNGRSFLGKLNMM